MFYNSPFRLLPGSVRGQVAVVLNGTLLALFLAFLVYDYGDDSADRLELNLRALDEQARILIPAVLKSTGSETSRLQDYLADTHRRMEANGAVRPRTSVPIAALPSPCGIKRPSTDFNQARTSPTFRETSHGLHADSRALEGRRRSPSSFRR